MQSKKILNKTVLQVVFMNVQCNASLSLHWRAASVCVRVTMCVCVKTALCLDWEGSDHCNYLYPFLYVGN